MKTLLIQKLDHFAGFITDITELSSVAYECSFIPTDSHNDALPGYNIDTKDSQALNVKTAHQLME